MNRQPLTIARILHWAMSFREMIGHWPTRTSGSRPGTICESWSHVDAALRSGRPRRPGGSSLAKLLASELGARNIQDLPPLTVEDILRWADAHFQRTHTWPTSDSGPIPDTKKEKWSSIDHALRIGSRGLP